MEGDSCWLQDQNVGGNNTLILMDLGFDYGGLVMGFCGPGIYHVMGETMRLMLRCQLNNHGSTGHLEGTRDNRGREGCLIFPPPVGSGVSLETARRVTIVCCRTKTFVEITP